MRIKNALIISDLHLGSDLIAQYRGYKDHWDFWLQYQQIHNSQVQYPDQPVFILGDIATHSDWIKVICSQLQGKLHFVLGNHDTCDLAFYSKQAARTGGTANALIMLPHQKLILSHIPVHPCFFESNKTEWKTVHGHLHTQTIDDPRYYNISFDQAQKLNDSKLFYLKQFYN
jgi:calcineurin-like phosphoesterase family protein